MFRKGHSTSYFDALVHGVFQWECTYKPINIYILKISLADLVNSVTIVKAKLIIKESRKNWFLLKFSTILLSFFASLFFPSKHLKALALNEIVSIIPARAVLSMCFRNECVHPCYFLMMPCYLNCPLLKQPIYIFFHIPFTTSVCSYMLWTFLILLCQFSLISFKNTGEVILTSRPTSDY